MTIEESDARWICCPKCEREANDCDVKQYLENNSDVYNMSVNELYETIAKSMRAIINRLSTIFDEEEKHYYRQPVEIKRDIKHEKNPMRIKQFNQELNESYKAYRKRGK